MNDKEIELSPFPGQEIYDASLRSDRIKRILYFLELVFLMILLWNNYTNSKILTERNELDFCHHPAQISGKVWCDKVKELSYHDNLYVFEPRFTCFSIYWSGGRPDIYKLMPYKHNWDNVNGNPFDLLTNEIDTLKNTYFAIVFMISDADQTHISRYADKVKKQAVFEQINRLEKEFLRLVSSHKIKNVVQEIIKYQELEFHVYRKEY